MECDEVPSPTVSTEQTILTVVIEAQDGCDVTTCGIPNAFVQPHVEKKDKDGNHIIMKISGICVDILCQINPIYRDYMVTKGNQKALYEHITQAIYRMQISAMLFYCKLMKALLGYGFKLNPYDLCVANKMVNGQQLTVCWHVDNLKSSHINPKVNDEFLQWIRDTFGQLREVKMTQGPIHDYLGMTLDYSVPGQVSINMSHYAKKMVKEFPQEYLKGVPVASPWIENLFKVQHNSAPLEKEQAELFHMVTVQGLFLCKCGHQDIAPAIAYLTTRVQKPNHTDWTKLCQML